MTQQPPPRIPTIEEKIGIPRNTLFLLATAIPLITMGVGCAARNSTTNSGDNSPYANSVAATNTNGNEAVWVDVEPGTEVAGALTVATKGYTAALNLYEKSGARFQFANCSGNPGSLSIKLGAKFMIDNRDNASHKIAIGAKIYQLSAYNYAIVTVQKAGSFNITCDGGGAARVEVQN